MIRLFASTGEAGSLETKGKEAESKLTKRPIDGVYAPHWDGKSPTLKDGAGL